MSIIELKNISVRYDQVDVLENISFSVESGDFIGLAGPNGAGKTTLVKTILGLLTPSRGEVELFGKNQTVFCEWNKIGYLPQKTSSINHLLPITVSEVVALGLLSQKKSSKKITSNDEKQIKQILAELNISNLQEKMFSQLSGGQQQKVLLARALVSQPEILIFDEPSTALDPNSREDFFQLIKKYNQEKKIAIILVTHDTGDIGKYAKKLLYIDKELVYFDSFSKFCQSPEMNKYFGKHEQHLICHQHD